MDEKTRERIRHLVDIYYDVQDVRLRSYNRLRTVGAVEGVHPEALKKLEGEIRVYIERVLRNVPIWTKYLSGIKGIGPVLAGGLLSYLDPYKARYPSGFWRFTGLHVEDGKAVKRRAGKKLDFNPKLRTLMWKIGRSFLFQGTEPYRKIYDERKVYENEKLGNPVENPRNCPHYVDCMERLIKKAERTGRKVKSPPCKLHVASRALRYMVKRFLSDLWVTWRKLEGLPVGEPYIHRATPGERLGKKAIKQQRLAKP